MSYSKSSTVRKKRSRFLLARDIFIIAVSIALAIRIVTTGILSSILDSASGFFLIESFVAGMFFTSIFTTAPAAVALGHIAQGNSVILVALIGAAGAVLGDLIIFRFVKDEFAEHLLAVIESKKLKIRLNALRKLQFFRWFSFLIAGLILASPLPDELGIGLLGFTKPKLSLFIPFSYFFNFLGILAIGLFAQALL